MYESVSDAFTPASKKFEGYLPWMYTDVKGLVTTGMGNLIDPVENALNLPWKHGVGGPAATQQEIMAAWNAVKHGGMDQAGGGKQSGLSDLRLDDDGIQQVIGQKLTNNESILRKRISNWDTLPANVQLACLLMAWAMGANFAYPHFLALITSAVPDFRAAADQAYMPDNPQKSMDYPPTSNPGLRPRNVLVKMLLQQAADQLSSGAALDQLSQPIDEMLSEVSSVVSGAMDFATAAAQSVADTVSGSADVVKRNPLKVAATFVGLGALSAAGTWYLAKK